jgi:hypothetical protein
MDQLLSSAVSHHRLVLAVALEKFHIPFLVMEQRNTNVPAGILWLVCANTIFISSIKYDITFESLAISFHGSHDIYNMDQDQDKRLLFAQIGSWCKPTNPVKLTLCYIQTHAYFQLRLGPIPIRTIS